MPIVATHDLVAVPPALLLVPLLPQPAATSAPTAPSAVAAMIALRFIG
jgi:hypothetical protein